LFKVSALEALLAGIVGTLATVYICRERGHHVLLAVAFFVALIFLGCRAAFEPASASLHLLSAAIGLTALALLFGKAEE
jgi:hypothetical protein